MPGACARRSSLLGAEGGQVGIEGQRPLSSAADAGRSELAGGRRADRERVQVVGELLVDLAGERRGGRGRRSWGGRRWPSGGVQEGEWIGLGHDLFGEGQVGVVV